MKTNGMTMLAVAMAFAAHGAGQKTVHNLDAFPLVCERVAAAAAGMVCVEASS